jgi:hypothetical protein
MQKFLIAIAIFLLTAHAAFSRERSITDTVPSAEQLIPVPKRALENSLRMKDSFMVMKKEVIVQQQILAITKSALANCDQQNIKLDSLDMVNKKIILNLSDQGAKKDEQVRVLTINSIKLQNDIRKQKWGKVKIGGISLSIIGALTFFLIKK